MLVFLPLELLPLIHSSTATLRKQPETLPSDAHGTRPAPTGRLCCPPPSALARPTPLPLLRHGLPRPHRVVPEDPLAHGHTLTRLPGDRSCCPPTPRSLWTGEAPSEHSPRSVTTPRRTFPSQMRGERHPRSGRRCPGSSSHFPPPGRHEHPIDPTDPTWCHADALSPLGSTHPAVGLSPRSPGVRPSRSRFSATRLRPAARTQP